MQSHFRKQLHRELFLRFPDQPEETAWEEDILQLLIGQDGSTTRLLESISRERISVHAIEQDLVQKLPRELAGSLRGNAFMRRLTTLEAKGYVLLDSLSYIALEALPTSAVQELQKGVSPIGHVLSDQWIRREFRDHDTALFEELWTGVGYPDPRASRSSCIYTPRGPCMIVAETFRRGVLELLDAGRWIRVGDRARTASSSSGETDTLPSAT